MSNKNFAGKEIFQRMNYLYQASELLIEKTRENNLETNKKCLEYISNYYSSLVINIGKKSQQRIDPSLKRTICKGCERLLVPGRTVKVRFRTKPVKHLRWTCLQCKSYKTFNMKKNYLLWSDNPNADLDNVNQTNTNVEQKCENSKSQTKTCEEKQ